MTEFEYRPIKKIIIDQIVKKSYEDFIKDVVGVSTAPALWADGILFQFWNHPVSEFLVVRALQDGVRYWDVLIFTQCDKYIPMLKRTDQHGELPVRNMQDHMVFSEFAKWLKAQPIWSDGN
jgi:hypothetical protein